MAHGWISDWDAWYVLPISAFSEEEIPPSDRQDYAKLLKENGRNPVYADWAASDMKGATYFGKKGIISYGLVPIFSGWLAAYLAVLAFRWIAAGFKSSKDRESG